MFITYLVGFLFFCGAIVLIYWLSRPSPPKGLKQETERIVELLKKEQNQMTQ